MSKMPETPEGIAFALWLASLAAAYRPDEPNREQVLLELYERCLRTASGTPAWEPSPPEENTNARRH